MLSLRPEFPTDLETIEVLLDLSFGVDRKSKVSYRYRRGVAPISSLCFVAELGPERVGAIRYWPMLLDDMPCLLLGPLAIHPDHKGTGIGRALVTHSLAAAAAMGERHVFLVGDHAYYRRFGFTIAPPRVVMPDERPERLHWLGLNDVDPPEEGGRLRSWRCLRREGHGQEQGNSGEPHVGLIPDSGLAWAS